MGIGRLLTALWPVQHAKEGMTRTISAVIAPYQLIAVATATNMREVSSGMSLATARVLLLLPAALVWMLLIAQMTFDCVLKPAAAWLNKSPPWFTARL